VVKNIGEMNTIYSRDEREFKKQEKIQLNNDSDEARLQHSKAKNIINIYTFSRFL